MPAKQVKSVFMTMTDETMIQYLRVMEPRTATKIMKEFKTPAETERIGKVMEKMRQAQASSNP
jgi:DNA-binding GntR family transcriptional regulator